MYLCVSVCVRLGVVWEQEKAKQAAADAEARHRSELERVRAELSTDHGASTTALVQQHDDRVKALEAEIGRLQDEAAQRRQEEAGRAREAEERQARAVEEASRAGAADHAELSRLRSEVDRLTAQHAEELGRLREEHQNALRQLEERHRREQDRMAGVHEDEMDAAERRHAAA